MDYVCNRCLFSMPAVCQEGDTAAIKLRVTNSLCTRELDKCILTVLLTNTVVIAPFHAVCVDPELEHVSFLRIYR